MRKTRLFIITFFMAAVLFFIPNVSKAAVSYTRTITSNDGNITLNLAGLTLSDGKGYEFALVIKGSQPSTWHDITDFSTTTAKVPLTASTSDIVAVLRKTDKGVLYVREKGVSDSYVVNALEVDLKLPYLQGINYEKDKNYGIKQMYDTIGFAWGSDGTTSFKFQKVTDKAFITKYLDIKNNQKSITALEQDLPSIPEDGFVSSTGRIEYSKYDDGLYFLWIKLTGSDCKEIYGCIIHDGLPKATTVSDYINGEGPKVLRIQVQSPKSGTYKTGQTVKIRVYFDKKITGTSVPTLKIKFGSSSTRSVTNGTIHNDNTTIWEWGQYIEYSYNIKSGDNGQLATVSLTGGDIKDTDGNNAILSCPVLTGSNTIKANTAGTVTNNTENQDKTNDTSKKDTSSSSSKKTSSSSSKNSSSSSSKKDTTTAKGKIPYTGANYSIIFVITIVIIAGIIAKVKYDKLKDI